MKNKLVIISFILLLTIMHDSASYAEVIPSVTGEKEIKLILRQLNDQGIKLVPKPTDTDYKLAKMLNEDGVKTPIYKPSRGKHETLIVVPGKSGFKIAGGESVFVLYKADINNDGHAEYVIASIDGSGGWFDIEAIYQVDSGKFKDIFNQIKILMRKLIRDADKDTYDLEEGYAGFMGGAMLIEKENEKTYFTIISKGEDHPSAWAYKFLWDSNGLRLTAHGAFNGSS